MNPKNDDSNWWSFSIDSSKRKEKIKNAEGSETVEVNTDEHMDYSEYIGLEKLLSCQKPSSWIPDERVFIITHQLFELTFKLMIFDLAVIGKTFQELLNIKDDDEFFRRSIEDEEFWRPALTASGRVLFNSKELLPLIMQYLERDETFNSKEFFYFRMNLLPASGFQTAQFRLIQRAFGKSNLFTSRLFPSDMYWEKYEGQAQGGPPVSVVDPLILREGANVATPADNTEMAIVKELDNLAHAVLSRLPDPTESGYQVTTIKEIQQSDIDLAVDKLRVNLANHRIEQGSNIPDNADEIDRQALDRFRSDFTESVEKENERRKTLKAAHAGASYLHNFAPSAHLAQVMKRILLADDALHGRSGSFFSGHSRVAIKHETNIKKHAAEQGEPQQPTGTGGGGTRYLGFSRFRLIPLFPALIAYRELEDAPQTLSFIA
jgi:tryptophan 2,3-dioxygenase